MKAPRISFLLLFGLLLGAGRALADPHPTVYNNLDGDRDMALDRVIKDAYGPHYSIIDVGAAQGFVGPQATRGEMPSRLSDGNRHEIGGYVVIIYLITAEGRVIDPHVVHSNDDRLTQRALDAMAQWRFNPARINGTAVASTAAQEFGFGPGDEGKVYLLEKVLTYQATDVLVHRTPAKEELQAYLHQLGDVAHRFFLGEAHPENLDIVLVLRPGRRVHCWLISSRRSGTGPELAPLRDLLEAVPAVSVKDGPVILDLLGAVAGGVGDRPETERAIPPEWIDQERALKPPLPYSSDAFMDIVWP